MNILIISLSSAIERRNFQQIQMEKLKLDFEFLEATSIHDIDMITFFYQQGLPVVLVCI
jgi:GR25 family glycosyltransferase involved in LPS biosynthesis